MGQELIPADAPYESHGLEMPSDPKARFELTQGIRFKMLDQMTKGGTVMPRTDDDFKALLELTRHIDNTTIGQLRAETEENAVNADAVVGAVISRLAASRGRLLVVDAPVVPRIIPSSPELEGPIDLVPDETHIGQQALNYEDFRERFGKK